MTAIPIKPSPGAGLLKGTAYFVVFLLTLTAWIDSVEFHLRNIGRLSLTSRIGFILAYLLVGWIVKRFGTGMVLLAGALLSVIAAAGYAFASTWGIIEAFGLLRGIGGSLVFTGLVIHFTTRFEARSLLWLFACRGTTNIIVNGLNDLKLNVLMTMTWYSGYLLAAIVYGIVVLAFVITRQFWNLSWFDNISSDDTLRSNSILKSLPVWGSALLIFLGAGLMTATFIYWTKLAGTSSENISFDANLFFRYLVWAVSCASLLAIGFLAHRINWRIALWFCAGIIIIGSALTGWGASIPVRFAGDIITALVIQLLLPVLLLYAKNHIPQAFLPIAIGWLIAVHYTGTALTVGLLGTASISLNMMVIVALAIALIVILEIGVRLQNSRKKKHSPEMPQPPTLPPPEQL